MFRPNHRSISPTVLWVIVSLLLLIIIATNATIWLAVKVRQEQHAISEIIVHEPANAVEHLKTWQNKRRWELLSIGIDVLVLLTTAAALLLLARAYFGSQKSLQRIKTLAWDILASIDQAVITTDQIGQITSMNPNVQKLLEIDETAIGRFLDEICPDHVPLSEVAQQIVTSGRSIHDMDFSLSRQGVQTRLRADGHLLRDTTNQVIGVVIYVRDITERMLIEDRMRRMERFMGLGTLAAGLHHEIKNPLSALSLHVQLLEEGLANNHDDEVGENLGVLKTEVTRINGVLESFRDFAALDKLNLANTDVTKLLTQTAELIRPKANQQNIELVLELPNSPPSLVSVDAARLEQVLLNLVINSLDAMPNGGKLALRLQEGSEKMRIDIADTGPGIPENLRARIFDPYFTTKTDGSGMGLAICDKVVQQHGGQIDIETGSAGTVFHVQIPSDAH